MQPNEHRAFIAPQPLALRPTISRGLPPCNRTSIEHVSCPTASGFAPHRFQWFAAAPGTFLRRRREVRRKNPLAGKSQITSFFFTTSCKLYRNKVPQGGPVCPGQTMFSLSHSGHRWQPLFCNSCEIYETSLSAGRCGAADRRC